MNNFVMSNMANADITDTTFSNRLSDCMDLLGYSLTMVQYRQRINEHMDALYNTNVVWSHNTVITTGGKGEGTAKYFESDVDRLLAMEDVICVDSCDQVGVGQIGQCSADSPGLGTCVGDYKKQGVTVFELETQDCSPGYARLRLQQLGSGYHKPTIERSLVREISGVFLDNSFPRITRSPYQMFDVNVRNIDVNKKSGPSHSYNNSDISYDFVNGFAYTGKHLLYDWANRSRSGDWPSPGLIKDVCETRGHLVPVADKNSRHSRTEWRICFTEGELLLVKSLNECQIKVLILLKHIARSMLTSICKDISSYVIKNVVMWMAERYQSTSFTAQTLYQRFFESLSFLRDRILEGQLQNYMITERNLLAGRISLKQKRELVAKINQLIMKQTRMFDGIGRLGKTLQEMANGVGELCQRQWAIKRDIVETLFLQKNVEFKKIECEWFRLDYTVEFEDLAERHEQFHALDQQIQALLVPDKEKFNTADIYDTFLTRLRDILS